MPKMSKQGQLDFSKLTGGISAAFRRGVPKLEHRNMITDSLIGAGIGGLGLGGAAWMREKDKDEDERKSVLLPLLAGVLGGGAAGAATGWARSQPAGKNKGDVAVDMPKTYADQKLIDEAQKLQREKYLASPIGKAHNWVSNMGPGDYATAGVGGATALHYGGQSVGGYRAGASAADALAQAEKVKTLTPFAQNSYVFNPARELSAIQGRGDVQKSFKQQLDMLHGESPDKINKAIDGMLKSNKVKPDSPVYKVLLAAKKRAANELANHGTAEAARMTAHNLNIADQVKGVKAAPGIRRMAGIRGGAVPVGKAGAIAMLLAALNGGYSALTGSQEQPAQ